MAAFSGGFSWANFDASSFGLTILPRNVSATQAQEVSNASQSLAAAEEDSVQARSPDRRSLRPAPTAHLAGNRQGELMDEAGAEDFSARTHCQQYGWNLPSCNDSTPVQEDSVVSGTEKSRSDEAKEGDTSCSWSDLAPPSDRLITCAAVLMLVFCLRRLLLAVMAHCTRRQPPPSLGFPAWEGPVALVQYLSVCESTAAAASLSCPAGVGLGITILLAGPVTLFLVSVYYIRRHLQDGEMLFEYNAFWTLKTTV